MPSTRGAARLAFAPSGAELAVQTETVVSLVGRPQKVVWRRGPGSQPLAIGWLGDHLLVDTRWSGMFTGVARQALFGRASPGAKLMRSTPLPGQLLDVYGQIAAVGSHDGLLAGPLGRLRSVLRIHPEPCDLEACEIAIGKGDVQMRLLGWSQGDRDVLASAGNPCRTRVAMERTGGEFGHLAGEKGRRHNVAAERGQVERAVRQRGGSDPPVRPPEHRLDRRPVAARQQSASAEKRRSCECFSRPG